MKDNFEVVDNIVWYKSLNMKSPIPYGYITACSFVGVQEEKLKYEVLKFNLENACYQVDHECTTFELDGVLYGVTDGVFYKDAPAPKPYEPTEGELMLMETQATMYEEMQASNLAQMESSAEIYETLLTKIGGNV